MFPNLDMAGDYNHPNRPLEMFHGVGLNHSPIDTATSRMRGISDSSDRNDLTRSSVSDLIRETFKGEATTSEKDVSDVFPEDEDIVTSDVMALSNPEVFAVLGIRLGARYEGKSPTNTIVFGYLADKGTEERGLMGQNYSGNDLIRLAEEYVDKLVNAYREKEGISETAISKNSSTTVLRKQMTITDFKYLLSQKLVF